MIKILDYIPEQDEVKRLKNAGLMIQLTKKAIDSLGDCPTCKENE